MNDELKNIALRIRALREISGMTVEETASNFKLTTEKYQTYENASEDIPMGFLLEFARFFKVEFTDLLTGGTPMLHTFSYVKKDRGVKVDRRAHYEYQHLAYNFANKKAEPFLVTIEPNDSPINLNAHEGQEFNYCVDGKLMIVINGQELILEAGDSLYFNSLSPHGMKALDGTTAKFLAIILN